MTRFIEFVEYARRQALEQRDPGAHGGGEIELAVHGAARDLGDLVAQADEIRQLVEHLILDDGRFHIGDEQQLAPPVCRLHRDIGGEAGEILTQSGGDRRRARGVGLERQIDGASGRQPVCGLGLRAEAAERGTCGIDGGSVEIAIFGIADQGQDMFHGRAYWLAGLRIARLRIAWRSRIRAVNFLTAGRRARRWERRTGDGRNR